MYELIGAFLGAALGASVTLYLLLPRTVTEYVLEIEEDDSGEDTADWWKSGQQEGEEYP